MRSDMKKVVVERPRWGSRLRNQKFGARLQYIPDHDYDEQPKKARGFESFHNGWGKSFTDVLGPLYRYLHNRFNLDDNMAYQKHEGIWYKVKLMRMVVKFDDPITLVYDIFLKRKVCLNWGENWVTVEKKQCSRRELEHINRLREGRERRIRSM